MKRTKLQMQSSDDQKKPTPDPQPQINQMEPEQKPSSQPPQQSQPHQQSDYQSNQQSQSQIHQRSQRQLHQQSESQLHQHSQSQLLQHSESKIQLDQNDQELQRYLLEQYNIRHNAQKEKQKRKAISKNKSKKKPKLQPVQTRSSKPKPKPTKVDFIQDDFIENNCIEDDSPPQPQSDLDIEQDDPLIEETPVWPSFEQPQMILPGQSSESQYEQAKKNSSQQPGRNNLSQKNKYELHRDPELMNNNDYTIQSRLRRKSDKFKISLFPPSRQVYALGLYSCNVMTFKQQDKTKKNQKFHETLEQMKNRYERIVQDFKNYLKQMKMKCQPKYHNRMRFIACFQQARRFRQVLNQKFFDTQEGAQYYCTIDRFSQENIIITNIPGVKFYHIQWKCQTSPSLVCTFDMQSSDKKPRKAVVHCLHWKMRENTEEALAIRVKQSDLMKKINSKFDLHFMLGDFNIDDTHSDNYLINQTNAGYMDLLFQRLQRLKRTNKQARKSLYQLRNLDSSTLNKPQTVPRGLIHCNYVNDITKNHFTYMYRINRSLNRFDRLLLGFGNGLDATKMRKHINVTYFQVRCTQPIKDLIDKQTIIDYLEDGKIRTPSDHFSVAAYVWLNYQDYQNNQQANCQDEQKKQTLHQEEKQQKMEEEKYSQEKEKKQPSYNIKFCENPHNSIKMDIEKKPKMDIDSDSDDYDKKISKQDKETHLQNVAKKRQMDIEDDLNFGDLNFGAVKEKESDRETNKEKVQNHEKISPSDPDDD